MHKKRMLLGVVLSLLLGGCHAHGGLIEGLVSYWSFDSDFSATSGGGAYDLTGYGTSGSASVVSGGKFGGAVEFNRANSEYLKTDTGTTYTPGSDLSYLAWYRLDTTISGSDRYFVMETPGVDKYSISYGLRESGASDIGQVYTIPSDGIGSSFFDISGGGTGGQWHSIVVTLDADLNGGTYTAYLDGSYAGMMVNDGQPAEGIGMVIGGHRGGTGRNFEGLIDDVAIWNRMLTTDEISTLQTQAVPEPSTISLLAIALLSMAGFRRARMLRMSEDEA